MGEDKRVYRRQGYPGKTLGYVLLLVSLVLIFTGLLGKGDIGADVYIEAEATPAPTASTDAFDETPETREITLPGITWHALQLGVFEDENAAKALAESFRKRGAAGYVYKDSRYRVLAAMYMDIEDARIVRERLTQEHEVETYVFALEIEPVSLRMKGMRGQLDALEAGITAVREMTEQLQAQSTMIDKREANAAEAAEAIMVIKDRADEVKKRMEQRFTQPRHAAVTGVIDGMGEASAFAASVAKSADMSLSELSTAVKYQTLMLAFRLKDIYESF